MNLNYRKKLKCKDKKCQESSLDVDSLTVETITLKNLSEEIGTGILKVGEDGEVTFLSEQELLDLLPTQEELITVNYTADGGTNNISYAHGLNTIPSFYTATAANAVSSDISHVEANATDIIVYFNAATPAGTDNIQLMIMYKE